MYNEIDDQFLLKQIKRNSFKNKHVRIIRTLYIPVPYRMTEMLNYYILESFVSEYKFS